MIEFRKIFEKDMIRNLLYSVCLHILFVFTFLLMNSMKRISNFNSTSLNVVNIDQNFLMNNDIKTTENDELPFLSISEKIKLYLYQTESGQTFNNTGTKQNDEEIKQTLGSLKGKDNMVYTTSTDKQKNQTIKSENKKELLSQIAKEVVSKEKKKDVLYIGKSGYDKLKAKNELKAKKITEEKKFKETKIITGSNMASLLNLINSETIFTDTADKKEVEIEDIDKDQEAKMLQKLNVDVNKIFTKEDLKIIKENIRDSGQKDALTIREKVFIQQQLKSCMRRAVAKNNKNSNVGVFVEVELSRNGFFNMSSINLKVIDRKNKYSQKDYDISIENVKTALVFCNPLRNLPILKFDSWRRINFVFDNN